MKIEFYLGLGLFYYTAFKDIKKIAFLAGIQTNTYNAKKITLCLPYGIGLERLVNVFL